MKLRILKSLTILLIISGSVAWSISSDVNTFSKMLVFTTLVQLTGYNIYMRIVRFFSEKLENERLREFSKQGIETKCPCNREIDIFLPIRLDQDNVFKCVECHKNFNATVNVKTFLSTNPIDLDKSDMELASVFDSVTKVKKH